MLDIFLGDLQNSYYRYLRNSVPIGMGFVAAYLQSRFDGDVRIHQFRTFEELHGAARDLRPDVVAFGSYSWNTSLTHKAAGYVRDRFPDAVIAVGGPDISQSPEMCARDLAAWPAVDCVMPNEGEGPARNLVEAVLGGLGRRDLRADPPEGCLSLDPDRGTATGRVMPRFDDDVNAIPSPYLTGLMDRFLADEDYLPIIQTARGCPYRCTFCVSGKDTWSKVKTFDFERVKAEIDYIAERSANPFMRLADENFGILKRDIRIAEYLMEKRRIAQFPAAVSIYTDKHPTDRVKQINLLMKDLMPFCISFQSMTPSVLDNIARINLKDTTIDQAIEFANEHGLLLVSELIFALPGETVDSFLDSIDQLIDRRFESIAMNQLRILKGTAMDTPEDRERFQVRTLYSMSENGYTNHPDMENVEIDEWVIANSSLTEEEYYFMNKFIFLFDFTHYRTFLVELLFFFETSGLRATRVLMRALEMEGQCPTVNRQASEFVACMRRMLFPSPEAVIAHVREAMRSDPATLEGIYRIEDRLMLEVLMRPGGLRAFAGELATAGRRLYEETLGPVPGDWTRQLDQLADVLGECFIPLDAPSPQRLTRMVDYDIAAWVAERYARPLADYRFPEPSPVDLAIRNYKNYDDLWSSDLSLLDRYKRHFATINSSNRRRFIVKSAA